MEYGKPWAVDPENSLNPAILNSKKELVCDVFFCELPEETQIKNLQLISCAPEMLEMLNTCLKSFNWISENCLLPTINNQEDADIQITHIPYNIQEIESLIKKVTK